MIRLPTINLGIQGRFTILNTSVLIAGSAILIGVIYFLVHQLIASELDLGMIQIFDLQEGALVSFETPPTLQAAIDAQVAAQSAAIVSDLLIWSLWILGGCVVVGTLVAWWISKRSLTRLTNMITTTRNITETDLTRRLTLSGPNDEIKELGNTIDSMLDRLSDAFDRQDRFIAGASHELRTPLTTARTVLQIPLAQNKFDANVLPEVEASIAANRRAEELIAALLTLTRTKRGLSDGHGAATDVPSWNALVSEVASELGDEANSRNQQLVLRFESTETPNHNVNIDPALARLAVTNLVENAIKHGTPGSTITIATTSAGNATALQVENDGADLTDTDVSQLKEPFNRGEVSRISSDGLGLGLALVDSAAQTSGGTLTLAARPGPNYGLTTLLTIPSSN